MCVETESKNWRQVFTQREGGGENTAYQPVQKAFLNTKKRAEKTCEEFKRKVKRKKSLAILVTLSLFTESRNQ